MTIKAELSGRSVSLTVEGVHVWLTEEQTRRLRAEVNRALQQIADQRK